MRIGGRPNVPACLAPCRRDLDVSGQNALPSTDLDLLRAVDWLFPHGMNHHTLMTGSKLLNEVSKKVVRKLSGLGELPAKSDGNMPAVESLEVDVCVVGGGQSGMAAAQKSAEIGQKTILLESFAVCGGSRLADPDSGPRWGETRAQELGWAGVDMRVNARAIGYYPEDSDGVLVVMTPTHLLRVFAKRYVYATGGYAQNRAFGDNDLPGVLSARAVGRLLCLYGIVAGERIVWVGSDLYTPALLRALKAKGKDVIVVEDILEARGKSRVTGAVVRQGQETREVDCDVICIAEKPAPATELLRQHGCAVELDPASGGFRVQVDKNGRTSVPSVFATGQVTGS
jgi:sarcosine oxidase subunit alpha